MEQSKQKFTIVRFLCFTCLQETNLKYKDTAWEIKDGKIYYVNSKHKKAEVAMLTPNQTDFEEYY